MKDRMLFVMLTTEGREKVVVMCLAFLRNCQTALR